MKKRKWLGKRKITHRPYQKLSKDSNARCKYCGGKAEYESPKNGHYCCSSYWNQCPESRKKQAKVMKIVTNKLEVKARMSAASKGRPGWSKGLTKETDKRVRKHSEFMMGRPAWNKGCAATPKQIARLTEGNRKWREENPKEYEAFLERRRARQRKPEYRAKISKTLKGLWADPEYQTAMRLAQNRKPNGEELMLKAILDKLFPGEYEYVGDMSFFVGRKCPDFVSVGGNQVIEYFGDYWHSKARTGVTEEREEARRISHFNEHGYECLVVWWWELEDAGVIVDKLIGFHDQLRHVARCVNF